MDYVYFIIGLVVGFIIGKFLPSYFSKKGENLATKEDIGKITSEIEKVKIMFKDQYELSKTERDFYENMTKTIYKFSAKIKKYEFENKSKLATKEIVLANEELKKDFFEFIDNASEFVGKSYVFLKEENYQNLKDALNTKSSFADLTKNLLYAMRKSLHPDTKLKPEENFKEFRY